MIAGMAAGCSSQVARFGGIDDIFTASTPNQRQIIAQQDQPYPAQTTVAATPVDVAPTGSVSRGALAPVASAAPVNSSSALAPAPVARTAPIEQPKIAAVKSSGETAPANQLPKSTDTVAVLPTPPRLKAAEAAPQASANAQAGNSGAPGAYKVQAGDTLSRISRKTGLSVAALKQANGMEDGLIRIGQTLKIPSGGNPVVASAAPAPADPVITGAAGPAKAAEPEQVAAYTPPTKAEKVIAKAVESGVDAPNSTGIGRMRWPARGRVISNFGTGGGKSNDGIDISVPEGTPVKAAENGVVIYAGDGLKEFGNTVLVRHEDGLVTVYGHASELKVARGDKVKRGQEIAVSGMSGTTDTPKLHFEVRKNSAPVDPATYLE